MNPVQAPSPEEPCSHCQAQGARVNHLPARGSLQQCRQLTRRRPAVQTRGTTHPRSCAAASSRPSSSHGTSRTGRPWQTGRTRRHAAWQEHPAALHPTSSTPRLRATPMQRHVCESGCQQGACCPAALSAPACLHSTAGAVAASWRVGREAQQGRLMKWALCGRATTATAPSPSPARGRAPIQSPTPPRCWAPQCSMGGRAAPRDGEAPAQGGSAAQL